METLQTLLVFTISIIAHEYGHYIIPYYWGWKPKIKYGLLYCAVHINRRKFNNLHISSASNIIYLGILFGLLPLLLLTPHSYLKLALFVYVLACSLDIIKIVTFKYYQHVKHYNKIYQIPGE